MSENLNSPIDMIPSIASNELLGYIFGISGLNTLLVHVYYNPSVYDSARAVIPTIQENSSITERNYATKVFCIYLVKQTRQGQKIRIITRNCGVTARNHSLSLRMMMMGKRNHQSHKKVNSRQKKKHQATPQ